MAIVEHRPEKSDPKPLILGVVLLLLIAAGVAFVVYSMIGTHKPKTIKLSEDLAKQQTDGGPTAPAPPGPAFPPAPPLEQAQDPGPTMITLDLKDVTVPDALAALEKQSGVKINSLGRGSPDGIMAMLNAKRINLSINNQPYWVAMRELLKQAELTTYIDWESRNDIRVQPGRSSELANPTVAVGSSLLVLKNVTSRFDADLVSPKPPRRSLNVYLSAMVEPKLKAYRIMPTARIETAVDENGVSLVRPPDQWDDRNGGNGRSNWQADIDCKLNFPTNAGQKIARLKGYVSVITAGQEETIKLKEPLKLKNSDQKVGGSVIRIARFTKAGNNNYEGQFQGDAKSPIFQDWDSFQNIVKVVDDKGKEYSHGGGGWGGGQKVMDFSLYFNASEQQGPPYEMQITMPSNFREIRVPFEFKDLPLPH